MENIITETVRKARERAKKWYYENKERALKSRKEYYAENSTKIKARISKHRSENIEIFREYDRRRYKGERKEKQQERTKRHYEENKQDYIERARVWNKEHPEVALQNCHKRRARKNNIEGDHFTDAQFKKLCNYYGNKCLCCGKTGVKLTADHVIPLVLQVPHSDEITNIQPLCKPCNSRKGTKTIDYR